MRLPKDPGEWTDRHLAQAIAERDRAFERYERRVDLNNREATDALYADYLRRDEIVDNLRMAGCR